MSLSRGRLPTNTAPTSPTSPHTASRDRPASRNWPSLARGPSSCRVRPPAGVVGGRTRASEYNLNPLVPRREYAALASAVYLNQASLGLIPAEIGRASRRERV